MAEWHAFLAPNCTLVLRLNYSAESMALLAALSEAQPVQCRDIFVVYVETGWASASWDEYVRRGEAFAKACGFTPVRINAPATFQALAEDRQGFPTPKFQWCAGILKGVPFLNWLDEYDLGAEWIIALPKRQALTRVQIPNTIEECPYHGDRRIIHPILDLTDAARDALLAKHQLINWPRRSLECEPCVNLQTHELAVISEADLKKTEKLEMEIGTSFFPPTRFGGQPNIAKQVYWARQQTNDSKTLLGDGFSRGCGDSFGCGL